ncbi:hypothetical protein AABM34_18055 [Lysinibacillus fusiformis]
MTIIVTQNPFSIYRGTNTSDQWYFEMREKAKEIQSAKEAIDNVHAKIEREKEMVVSQIEEEFSLQKDPKLLNLKRDVHNLRSIRLRKYSGTNFIESTSRAFRSIGVVPRSTATKL